MASILPPFPRLVFMVFEPISLVGGIAAAWFSTNSFITDQYPSTQNLLPHTPNAQILACQLGNTYGLLALLGIAILNLTAEVRIVKAYLVCLAIADIGHVVPTMMVLGMDRSLDISGWNMMAWGNIGATLFLFMTRIACLLGLFGTMPNKIAKGKAKAL